MTYYQITSEERYTIAALRREGFCSAEIARRLGRSTRNELKSTLELIEKVNGKVTGVVLYTATTWTSNHNRVNTTVATPTSSESGSRRSLPRSVAVLVLFSTQRISPRTTTPAPKLHLLARRGSR